MVCNVMIMACVMLQQDVSRKLKTSHLATPFVEKHSLITSPLQNVTAVLSAGCQQSISKEPTNAYQECTHASGRFRPPSTPSWAKAEHAEQHEQALHGAQEQGVGAPHVGHAHF